MESGNILARITLRIQLKSIMYVFSQCGLYINYSWLIVTKTMETRTLNQIKVKVFTAVLLFVISIPFYIHSEWFGYHTAQKQQLTTEEQCAESSNANLSDWFACLTALGVSDCLFTYKTDEYFQDKGCLRYVKEHASKSALSNENLASHESSVCDDEEC